MIDIHGATVEGAELREQNGRQVLRLHLRGGGILAIDATGDELHVADQTAIP